MNDEQPKILIVDDVPLNIQVLSELLQEGHRIFFATSGEDALTLAAATRPDLILLDIMMPEMDGYEVCRRLQMDHLLRDTPVIFVSAMGQPADEAVGLELGAVDYITKPFNPPIVKLRVRNQLELKRQRDQLERLASVDGLTGLPNRRAFDLVLEREWRRASRNRSNFSLLLLDIDHFKAYNDVYGHLAGDDCLQQVATVLQQSLVRPADFVGRFGGEEFVCILPETDLDGAMVMAEKLRVAVEQQRIPHIKSAVTPWVTISLGVATTVPTSNQDAAMVVGMADQSLYRAKNAGRNRCAHQVR